MSSNAGEAKREKAGTRLAVLSLKEFLEIYDVHVLANRFSLLGLPGGRVLAFSSLPLAHVALPKKHGFYPTRLSSYLKDVNHHDSIKGVVLCKPGGKWLEITFSS